MTKTKSCFLCGDKGTDVYGYTICDSCKSQLKLFSDDTIRRHISLYKKQKKTRSYIEEIRYRLDFLEKDYIKKRLKLLHILERLKHIHE